MNESSAKRIYVLGDGDKIRERVEHYLLNDEMESLTSFSQSLIDGVNTVKLLAISTMEAQVIMAGGDDLLFLVDSAKYRREKIEQLAQVFHSRTNSAISFGIGTTIESAYLNLRRAKASNQNKIVEEEMVE